MNRIFTKEFLMELLIVGFLTVLFGYIAGFIVGMLYKVSVPETCANWNKNYVMEQTLFLTGVLAYLSLELAGVNTWKCKQLLKQ